MTVWLALYLLLHVAVRLFLSDSLKLDDAEQVVAGQELALGYALPQPPLYTWIYWLASRWMGVGLPVLMLIKYAMIAAMFNVLWQVTFYLFEDSVWRIAAVLSFLLLPVFAWQMHVDLTHTVLMSLACAMTFHALLRLSVKPGFVSCAYLALAVGVGLLSKYGYHLFLLLLLTAVLTLPKWRRLVCRRGPLLALVCAVAAAAPYHLWMYEHSEWLVQRVADKFAGEHHNGSGALKSLRPLTAMLEYLLPLLLAMLWAAPRSFLMLGSSSENQAAALLTRFHLILFALMAAAFLPVSLTFFKSRWMTPVLFLMPLWLLAYAQAGGLRAARRLTGAATVLSFPILAVQLGNLIVSPLMGSAGRLHTPVALALAKMPEPCREASAYLAMNNVIAAHARVSWPDKTAYSFAIRPVHLPLPAGMRRLAVLSSDKDIPWATVRDYVKTVRGGSIDQSHIRPMGKTEASKARSKFSLYCSLLDLDKP
ncbi:MAG: glycosyltransferase family 39 protein [Gammaproteobacteria bacterium]